MANLAMLAVFPNGVWENIIFAFNSVFKNYALAVIILTVAIKLITLPIDFYNRRATTKMNEVQEKLAPKMKEIQKKYPDKTIQNQKLGELYRKEGFNPMGSCLAMLGVMIMSVGVFITLFASLNNVAAYKITTQYENLQNAYVQQYVMDKEGIDEAGYQNLNLSSEQIGDYIIEISTTATDAQKETATNAVKEKYEQVKESFLWVKNVWIADSPLKKAIPDFDTYYNVAKLREANLTDEQKEKVKAEYEAVMSALNQEAGVNGFFVLAILAGVTAFLYQYILTKKKNQKSAQNKHADPNMPDPSQSSGKALMIILPVIMVYFTLQNNSIFSLYIVISQLFGMATAPLINKFIQKKDKKA
ncbi:MAG: membrane protein insertase YidC [Clostridia bacterium]|nr:membrane protein insertase YidC [Clostridia bacterium]